MSIPGNGHLPASTDLPDHSSSASDPEADYRPISAAATDSDTDTDPDPAPHHRLGSIGNGVSELDLDSGGDDDHCEGADGEDTVAVRRRKAWGLGRRRPVRSRRTSGAAAPRSPRAPRRGSWTRCAAWSSPARRLRGPAASPRTSGSTASAPSAPAPAIPTRRRNSLAACCKFLVSCLDAG
ncbi:hypothetical protein OsI_02467 [Oryza sativa Indica Group]|uniref:Uncharacterized protein n=1 Tax=Oryza sativa subsp. indica TaxID=39946 RepID=B8AAB2_ORYSI|nr:hypothetical protein OsI_02467 [Oryza sativa Indica Group]